MLDWTPQGRRSTRAMSPKERDRNKRLNLADIRHADRAMQCLPLQVVNDSDARHAFLAHELHRVEDHIRRLAVNYGVKHVQRGERKLPERACHERLERARFCGKVL